MSSLSSPGHNEVESLAQQTGFSPEAVQSMLRSVCAGGGGMAQFSHPEFGGSGQWMRGGMLMISGPSDRELERRIGRLCDALAEGIAAGTASSPGGSFQTQVQTSSEGFTRVQDSREPSGPQRTLCGESGTAAGTLFDRQAGAGTWYPASLGTPNSSGSQNDARYAWFADARRLAIDDGQGVRIYDTGEHRIGGVSQQQGARGTVSFVSQLGTVDIDSLPLVTTDPAPGRSQESRSAGDESALESPAPAAGSGEDASARDPFVALEKLADLHARGIVGDDEFAAKKAELLKRI